MRQFPKPRPWFNAIPIALMLAIGWHLYDASIQKQAAAKPVEPPRAPYVATDTALSDSERLRIVVVPHPLGKAFDARCLLYTGREGAAQLVCPNATQEQLAETQDGTPRGAR